MLPALLGMGVSAIAGAFSKKKSSTSAVSAVAKAVTGQKLYRRRKKRLTNADIAELTMLKQVLGKTAAANALPFYLGRR